MTAIFLCTATLFAAILSAVSSAEAAPFYRETFNLCDDTDSSSKSATELANWKAFRAGSTLGKIGFLKINPPGSPNLLVAYNSTPVGPVDGSAFWSKNISDLTIFTDEFSVDVANLTSVSYEQRLNGYDTETDLTDGSRFALLVGESWYISDQSISPQQRGAWEGANFILAGTTFGISPNKIGLGPDRPTNSGFSLPSRGTITAFGVFFPEVTGRLRIDNFTLSDAAAQVSVVGQQGSLGQCTELTSNPIGNPGTAGSKPNSPAETGTFCAPSTKKPLGKVTATAANKRLLLRSITGTSLEAARDRALFALILYNGLKIESLVNVAVRDYYSVGALQILNTSGIKQEPKAVQPKVKVLVDAYVASALLTKKGSLPLLQGVQPKTGILTGSALCGVDIRKLLQRRADKARLSGQFKIP